MFEFIYPVPEKFPDNRARFIQIINSCYSLAKMGVTVKLITGVKKGYDKDKILHFYGLTSCENLKIVKLPILRRETERHFKISWNGSFYFSFLIYLLTRKSVNAVIFLRHLKLTKFLLNFKKIINTPILFEVHEIFHLNNSLKESKKTKLKKDETKVYNTVNALICISKSIKDFLIDFTNRKNDEIFVIPCGVRKEWLVMKRNVEASYICYTGSLYDWKGVDTLIHAMKFIPHEKLLIVGGGRRLEELKKLVLKENVVDRVIFTGPVAHESIPEYLSKAKIAVLPNVAQGPSQFSSPLKLFEYMALGIPIVASDLPIFREILQKETAIFFKPGNAKALAEAIKKVLNSKELSEKLSINTKKIAENYTYEKRAEKIYKICLEYLKC